MHVRVGSSVLGSPISAVNCYGNTALGRNANPPPGCWLDEESKSSRLVFLDRVQNNSELNPSFNLICSNLYTYNTG